MVLDRHVLALDETGLVETLTEGIAIARNQRRSADIADHRQCPLLSLRCEGPCRRAGDSGTDIEAARRHGWPRATVATQRRAAMIFLFHRTTAERAVAILRDGFRDGSCTYLTDKIWTGVWFSDQRLDSNEGAYGNVLLRVRLAITENEIADFEWIEEGKGYREWLIPARLINGRAIIEMIEE
jgi:hypothetical protein